MADPNRPRHNVPRFSSFKAKQSNHVNRNDGGRRNDGGGRNHHNSLRDERGPTHQRISDDNSQNHRRKDSKQHHPLPSRSSDTSTTPFPATSEMSMFRDRDLFVADWKGDLNNLKYGEINQHAVPMYFRPGRTLLVGLHAPKPALPSYTYLSDEEALAFDTESPAGASTMRDGARLGYAFGDEDDVVDLEDAQERAAREMELSSMITPKG